MKASEFINEIETAWDKELSGKQAQIYCRKLERFGDWQLNDLLEKVLETCKYFPKLADIWVIAKEIGLFKEADRKGRTTGIHTWEPSSCNRCGGDGRLIVFMELTFERTETSTKQHLRLRRIFRASDASGIGCYERKAEPHEFSFLYRCSCAAGDAETLPTAWPKWKGTELYQPAGKTDEDPKPEELKAVQSLVNVARSRPERRNVYDESEVVPF